MHKGSETERLLQDPLQFLEDIFGKGRVVFTLAAGSPPIYICMEKLHSPPISKALCAAEGQHRWEPRVWEQHCGCKAEEQLTLNLSCSSDALGTVGCAWGSAGTTVAAAALQSILIPWDSTEKCCSALSIPAQWGGHKG